MKQVLTKAKYILHPQLVTFCFYMFNFFNNTSRFTDMTNEVLQKALVTSSRFLFYFATTIWFTVFELVTFHIGNHLPNQIEYFTNESNRLLYPTEHATENIFDKKIKLGYAGYVQNARTVWMFTGYISIYLREYFQSHFHVQKSTIFGMLNHQNVQPWSRPLRRVRDIAKSGMAQALCLTRLSLELRLKRLR